MGLVFCPKCFAPRAMNVTISEQEVTGPDEQLIKVVIETYHCAICRSFVRSESVHQQVNEKHGEAKPANVKT